MSGHYARRGGQVVSRIPVEGLAEFLPAFAKALRSGVDVELLDGLSTLSEASTLLVVRSTDDRRKVLLAEQASLRQQRSNAERQSDRQTDPDEADRWADRAAKVSVRLAEVSGELDRLTGTQAASPLGEAFTGEVHFLLEAVRAMATPGVSVPRNLSHHYSNIVTDRRIEVMADGRVQWSCRVRVPAAGGVVALGPITWIPESQPTLTLPLLWAANEAAGVPGPWLTTPSPPRAPLKQRPTASTSARIPFRGEKTRLKVEREMWDEQLRDVGLTTARVNTLLAVAFPAAPAVVIAQARGEAPPSWVPEQWADPVWMKWLHREFTAANNWGRNGVWAEPSWLRQAALDYTLDRGGRVTASDLLGDLEKHVLDYQDLRLYSTPGGYAQSKKGTTRPWQFPLERTGSWPHRGTHKADCDTFGFRVIRCDRCGEVADIATRALEIVGDVLCPNGHMPWADPDDELARRVVVPSDYKALRVPRRVWEVRRRRMGGPRSRMFRTPSAPINN